MSKNSDRVEIIVSGENPTFDPPERTNDRRAKNNSWEKKLENVLDKFKSNH